MKKYPMTLKGKKKLEKELNYLKEVKVKEINEEIKNHHAFCDFSDNASFDQMLDEQALVKKKMNEIQDQLAFAEVITDKKHHDHIVQLGDKVYFKNITEDTKNTYQIVGSHEANVIENKISFESPIGKSFLGRELGEEWIIKIPDGEIKVHLLEIK